MTTGTVSESVSALDFGITPGGKASTTADGREIRSVSVMNNINENSNAPVIRSPVSGCDLHLC